MIKTLFMYILLLVSGGLGIAYYLLLDKYQKQTLQIRVLSRQNNGLTAQINSINKPTDNIQIYYKAKPYNAGYTSRPCSLYIAPLSNSAILRSLPSNTKLEIADYVEAYEISWYEVKLIINETVNIKGFIREDFIIGVNVVETQSVSKRYYWRRSYDKNNLLPNKAAGYF